MNRSRVGDEWHARAIRPFGGSFHAPHDAVGLQCDCHRALIVRKWRTVRPEQLPRATPFAGAEKRAMPPERCRCLVVIGDPPGGISGVDRGRQCIEQITKPAFALAQGRMGPGAINRHNIVAGGRFDRMWRQRGQVHSQGIRSSGPFSRNPPVRKLATGAPRNFRLPSENSTAVKKLRRLRQIFSRLMASLNKLLPSVADTRFLKKIKWFLTSHRHRRSPSADARKPVAAGPQWRTLCAATIGQRDRSRKRQN
jgi:hypothetical protein